MSGISGAKQNVNSLTEFKNASVNKLNPAEHEALKKLNPAKDVTVIKSDELRTLKDLSEIKINPSSKHEVNVVNFIDKPKKPELSDDIPVFITPDISPDDDVQPNNDKKVNANDIIKQYGDESYTVYPDSFKEAEIVENQFKDSLKTLSTDELKDFENTLKSKASTELLMGSVKYANSFLAIVQDEIKRRSETSNTEVKFTDLDFDKPKYYMGEIDPKKFPKIEPHTPSDFGKPKYYMGEIDPKKYPKIEPHIPSKNMY